MCRETKVPYQLLDLLGDSVVLLTKVRNWGQEVCRGNERRGQESGSIKFRCPWDTQGNMCPQPNMQLSREGRLKTQISLSFQRPLRSIFFLWLLCSLRAEKFISWVLVGVLFLERLKKEKMD